MQFPRSFTPSLPSLGLSEDEKQLIATLESLGYASRWDMLLAESYYLGTVVVQNLRIAVPKELEFLIPVMGWPRMAVDPYVERLSADCFRRAGATDGDQHLMDAMDANGFGAEQSVAFADALTLREAFWMVGSPAESGGAPLVTVESPLNMTVQWDLRGTAPRAGWQIYSDEDGTRRAALVRPGVTVHLATNDRGEWVIVNRDEHSFDFVPIVRMANKPRTTNRDGYSEITPELRWLTDAACRTMLGLEVARELYSVPQKAVLGATEDAFVKSDGTQASVWETYITKTLGLERDENGELPQLFQFQAYDPSVFTKLIDMYASQAAGIVGALPQNMGLYTTGNPISSESVVAQESTRDRRAVRMQSQFTPPLCELAKMVVRFENGGDLPSEYERLTLDWDPVTMPTPGVTADAITKQIAAGAIPATSDVTLRELGYSARDRVRLEQDRAQADGEALSRAILGAATGEGGASGSANGQ